jgi:hypothetical protein
VLFFGSSGGPDHFACDEITADAHRGKNSLKSNSGLPWI